MEVDPMDRPPAGGGLRRKTVAERLRLETRVLLVVWGVMTTWVLSSVVLGPKVGSGTAVLSAVVLVGCLLRDRMTPTHLSHIGMVALPALLAGLWVS
jgi:hypothetical protein